MTEEINATWLKLTNDNTSTMPYEFVELFNLIMQPYYEYYILRPHDRMEIQLLLKEALLSECHISKQCTQENISNFCHLIVFKILIENKESPSDIKEVIKNLINQN